MISKKSSYCSLHNKFVVVLDSNQKGNKLRYQGRDQSDKFVIVTGRFLKRFITVEEFTDSVNLMKFQLTYIDQDVPSMTRMPPFKNTTVKPIKR